MDVPDALSDEVTEKRGRTCGKPARVAERQVAGRYVLSGTLVDRMMLLLFCPVLFRGVSVAKRSFVGHCSGLPGRAVFAQVSGFAGEPDVP